MIQFRFIVHFIIYIRYISVHPHNVDTGEDHDSIRLFNGKKDKDIHLKHNTGGVIVTDDYIVISSVGVLEADSFYVFDH